MKQAYGKIGIISPFHREGTGACKVLEYFLRGVMPTTERIVLVTPQDSMLRDVGRELGISVLNLDTPRDAIINNFKGIAKLLPDLRDCCLIHSWHSRGFELALWASRQLGLPCSGTLHDHPGCSTYGLLRRQLIRTCIPRMNGVAYVSRATERAWKEQNLITQLTSVIYNGLEDTITPRKHIIRKRLNVGFLGMYSPWKGFDIVESWIKKSEKTQIQWMLFGDVADCWKGSLSELMGQYGGRISIHGPKPTEEIFRELDILVHTSTEFDPLPTVLIEALRAGIPSIASSLGGASEIITHQKTGFLFDPSHSEGGLRHLLLLEKDADLRSGIGKAAREDFKRFFFVSRMIEKYNTFWDSILRNQEL